MGRGERVSGKRRWREVGGDRGEMGGGVSESGRESVKRGESEWEGRGKRESGKREEGRE